MKTDSNAATWTVDKTQSVDRATGNSALNLLPPRTVIDVFEETVRNLGDCPALHQKSTKENKSYWITWTWNQYKQLVEKFAKSLITIDFRFFDVVSIVGFNSPEWFISNFGAIAAGGISAGIFEHHDSDTCEYIIARNSKAKVVVVDSWTQIEKFASSASGLPDLAAIVIYGISKDQKNNKMRTKIPVPVYKFDEFLQLGSEVPDSELQNRRKRQTTNQVCTLVYTSGTTGPPKGVMITHDNITWTSKVMSFKLPRLFTNYDRMLSYLPLSHIAAQMLDMYYPLLNGCQVWFAQPNALKGSLAVSLREVRPTAFFGAPRVWTKIYERLYEAKESNNGIKKMVFNFATSTAGSYWRDRQYGEGRKVPRFYGIAKRILRRQVHARLGLDRCISFHVSGGPIKAEIIKFFASLDMPIMEMFGQSECTGPCSSNSLDAFKFGTCGQPLLGTETTFDPDTNELCYRGRHVFAGYLGMPEETAAVFDTEGWFHTGDVVKFDDDNDPDIPAPSSFISYVGRIDELKKVPPEENEQIILPSDIENELLTTLPALSNCMVVDQYEGCLVVLLCLQVEMDEESNPTEHLTGKSLETSLVLGSTATRTTEAKLSSLWTEYINKGISMAAANVGMAKRELENWILLDTDFSENRGELTPGLLKLRRSFILEKYSSIINETYEMKPSSMTTL